MTYEIISCDWNKEQTVLWMRWIIKNCPTANIYTIPDTTPVPGCWSCGKLNCFTHEFETDRIMYMDTDTIVTRDLEPLWDEMGDCKFAASSKIPLFRLETGKRKQINDARKQMNFKHDPIGWSSGMLMLKGYDPKRLYEGWIKIMRSPDFQRGFGRNQLTEEFALSLFMACEFEKEEIWDIPLEVHGNICGGRHFGGAKVPAVIHYHKPVRLRKEGLGEYLI